MHNGDVRIRHWKMASAMNHLARNQDGDELLFIHEGDGDLYCDWGRLGYRDGDYIVIPRGGMWRIEPRSATTMLLVECTEGTYTLPEKGLLGPHAIFDPAMLDVPRMDEAFRAQQTDDAWTVKVKRLRHAVDDPLSIQSSRRRRLAWRSLRGSDQRARHPDQ
jgi:homogentisate 1,2-dioxygenase